MNDPHRKLIWPVTALIVFLSSLGAQAGPIIGVPDPGTGNCIPFSCNQSLVSSGQSLEYYLIISSKAFSAPIDISSLSFFAHAQEAPTITKGTYALTLATTTDPIGSPSPINLANAKPFVSAQLSGAVKDYFTIEGSNYRYDPALGNLVVKIIVSDQAIDALGGFATELNSTIIGRTFHWTDRPEVHENGGLVVGINMPPLQPKGTSLSPK